MLKRLLRRTPLEHWEQCPFCVEGVDDPTCPFRIANMKMVAGIPEVKASTMTKEEILIWARYNAWEYSCLMRDFQNAPNNPHCK